MGVGGMAEASMACMPRQRAGRVWLLLDYVLLALSVWGARHGAVLHTHTWVGAAVSPQRHRLLSLAHMLV